MSGLVRCSVCNARYKNEPGEPRETFETWDSKPVCLDCIGDAGRLSGWIETDRRKHSAELLRAVHVLHHVQNYSPGCDWCRDARQVAA